MQSELARHLRNAPNEKLPQIRTPIAWIRLSPAAYIKRAALDGTVPAATNDAKLERLATLVHRVCEAVDDEIDYRTAVAAWDRHVKSGEKLLKPEDVWRELGV